MTHVSVNNAVFLCKACAEEHKKENCPLVSLVRPLDSDFWSHEQIGTLQSGGGNKEFLEFMSQYDFDGVEEGDQEEECKVEEGNEDKVQVKGDHFAKYNSVAGGYWRDKI